MAFNDLIAMRSILANVMPRRQKPGLPVPTIKQAFVPPAWHAEAYKPRRFTGRMFPPDTMFLAETQSGRTVNTLRRPRPWSGRRQIQQRGSRA